MDLPATWQIGAQSAEVRCADLSAKLDFSQAARGLYDVRWSDQALIGGDLLGVRLAERSACGQIVPSTRWLVADCYSRAADLVVTFAAEGASPVRWQVYWTASVMIVAGECCPMFDVRVSVQTSALDTHLECLLSSRLPGWEASRLAVGGAAEASCFLLRPNNAPVASLAAGTGAIAAAGTYIEMVHPADIRNTELAAEAADAPSLQHHLFDTDLEKGVIVRARARGLVVPRARDVEIASAAWQAFVSEPPPLTT